MPVKNVASHLKTSFTPKKVTGPKKITGPTPVRASQSNLYNFALTDITVDKNLPKYKTAKGFFIALNKPAPKTVLPSGKPLSLL